MTATPSPPSTELRTGFERLLSRVVPVRAGEGPAIALLFTKIFMLLFAYYLLKPVREALILTESSAEVRSYSLAAQALLLMLIIPIYTAFLRRIFPHYHLVPWITVFLAANLAVFLAAALLGYQVGVEFFIWLGIFNVLIVAQFWAFAADLFSVEAGERLFVLIAVGASIGAWGGAVASKYLFALVGVYGTMGAAIALLLATVPLTPWARRVVPPAAQPPPEATAPHPEKIQGVLGGFRLVLGDPYLRLLALFMLILQCINSTGEYLLSSAVAAHAGTLVAAGAIDQAGPWIGAFYGEFYAWVNGAGIAIQLLLVARIFRHLGVGGATRVLPGFAALGYGLLIFVPVFGVIRLFKIAENSLNYSLQNTARHALILPCDEEMKYAGKTTIDTFFWRLGDMAHAGIVFAGVHWLAASPAQFAALNCGLALLWFAVATHIAGRYQQLTGNNRGNNRGQTPIRTD
jgi:AAA family ATP:ADP antiporter